MTVATRRELLIGAGAAALASTRAWAAPPKAKESEWEYLSAGEMASALRARKISALELIDLTIARIEALDSSINAVVVRDFDRAREAAKAADTALSRGETPPLLGVPATVKESFDIAGLPTSWGDPKFRHSVPKEDALAVSRLKQAGAVILGKTNVPSWLSDWQSYNDIYGTTNNPWDTRLTPGGSSGGSAAALTCGFGPLSIGSDLGGSLRTPAHYCGVYAHKPTPGLAPRRGQTPPGTSPFARESDLAVVGPMARNAADLALAFDVIAGPDEERASVAWRLALPPARRDKLESFRVLVIDSHPLAPTGHAVKAALARLSERLVRVGGTVAHESPLLPDLANSARLFSRLLSAYWGAGATRRAYSRLRAEAAGYSPRDHSLAAERARGGVLSYRDWLAAESERGALQQRWRALLEEWDVVLCPAAPTPAFPHDHSQPMEARRLRIDEKSCPYIDAQIVWPALATTSGLPATVAPIDHLPSGLPIGVQIIGAPFEDRTTIAFAGLLERAFGGFVAPQAFQTR